MSGSPLITLFVYAFNHEKFIREAVEGAFAQTYNPLEIILSDDCSTDRTYEIMQEMAERYSGPHKVITTGAAPGFFAVRLGKLLGAQCCWLDSIANAERLSLSGERAGPVADLWLTQWPGLASPHGPHYQGAVL
jgi:cellulose synthase/poly-beta-1,6-N-acetylglucosamine synthase-like glycosyltransferase